MIPSRATVKFFFSTILLGSAGYTLCEAVIFSDSWQKALGLAAISASLVMASIPFRPNPSADTQK